MYKLVLSLLCCFTGIINSSQAATRNGNMIEEEIIAKAKKIHESILTLDTHVDFVSTLATPEHNPGTRLDKYKVDLVKMKEGGLDGVFLAVYVQQKSLSFDS